MAAGPDGVVFLDSRGRLISNAEGASGFRPVWSPDGQYVYAIDYKLGAAVERWDSYGKNRVVLPITGVDDPRALTQMISISPSGKRAAILMRDFNEMLITDVRDKGLSVLKILPRDFGYVSQSVWLDDHHLLFVGKQGGTRQELWELDVESGTTTKRGIGGLWLQDFVALSPDGNSVVVTATNDVDVSWDLWLYNLETSQLTQLTTGTRDENVAPSWRH